MGTGFDKWKKRGFIRLLAFDIEASNLAADFGLILTFGSKLVGRGRVEVLRIDDYFDAGKDLIRAEKKMLRDVSQRMLDCDAWLGHFSRWFDVVFINSRLLYHSLPTLPTTHPQIDTWRVAKNHLKLRNNRLQTIQEFLKLEDEKNSIKPEQWIRALNGDRRSISYIVEHNRRDVLVLEQAYLRLRPLIPDHPFLSSFDSRPKCGTCGGSLQKRGRHLTKSRSYQRFVCTSCGSWTRGSKALEVAKSA